MKYLLHEKKGNVFLSEDETEFQYRVALNYEKKNKYLTPG